MPLAHCRRCTTGMTHHISDPRAPVQEPKADHTTTLHLSCIPTQTLANAHKDDIVTASCQLPVLHSYQLIPAVHIYTNTSTLPVAPYHHTRCSRPHCHNDSVWMIYKIMLTAHKKRGQSASPKNFNSRI